MIYNLSKEIWFPPVSEADDDGLLAIGGDLSPERLLLAYRSGIFPWYEEGQPILWWSPDPRMVLYLENLKVSKSLKKKINKKNFTITFNNDFESVIRNCAVVQRNGQNGTWITEEMIAAYINLHKSNHAQSVEVWFDNELVGGLYGIDLKDHKVFCGESMFSTMNDASKVGLYFLVEKLKKESYQFIDCQMHTPHLESLGATTLNRKQFLVGLFRLNVK